jgi:hypothetical protein
MHFAGMLGGVSTFSKLRSPVVTQPAGIEDEVIGEISGIKMRGFIDRWADDGEFIFLTIKLERHHRLATQNQSSFS